MNTDLATIERHAKALMTAHGVGYMQFAFDGGKRRLGATHLRNGIPFKISLSKHYAVLLPEDEIRDVILHEIAHALTPGHNHDAVWKAAARKIGANPNRCARPSASPAYSIHGECPKCETVVSKHHRMPRKTYAHRSCMTPLVYVRL